MDKIFKERLMKSLKCEMCGSNQLIKQDGLFVCQSCGTKYSVEEAKKMMVEGTVEVQGTVKIDQSSELSNLYQLARRAIENENNEHAEKYYSQIIVKDPSSWEANFYTVYFQSLNCKLSDVEGAARRLINCEDNVLQLIKERVLNADERKKAIKEVGDRLLNASHFLFNMAKNYYDGLSWAGKSNYTQEFLDRSCAARDILYSYGDNVISIFNGECGQEVAVLSWKAGIIKHDKLLPYFEQRDINLKIMHAYAKKIRQYEPNYKIPFSEQSQPETPQAPTDTQPNTQGESKESKAGIGVVMGLFLGLIGLIIGICIYKEGSYERQTFLKGFWITIAVSVAVSVIFSIAFGISLFNLFESLESFYYY